MWRVFCEEKKSDALLLERKWKLGCENGKLSFGGKKNDSFLFLTQNKNGNAFLDKKKIVKFFCRGGKGESKLFFRKSDCIAIFR